jgi:AcrR family transcriptional regulator
VKNSESYGKWIEAAYIYFATEGPDKISVMELSKQCGLPRTNFYYYFENKEELIDKVIEFHFKTTTEIFNLELENKLHCFIPDLYVIIYKFKIGIQFSKQLFLNREYPTYNKAYKQSVALSSGLIVPKFMEFFKIDLPFEVAKALWTTLTDSWYSRLNFDNYSVDYLCELCYEIMDTVTPLIEKKQIT